MAKRHGCIECEAKDRFPRFRSLRHLAEHYRLDHNNEFLAKRILEQWKAHMKGNR